MNELGFVKSKGGWFVSFFASYNGRLVKRTPFLFKLLNKYNIEGEKMRTGITSHDVFGDEASTASCSTRLGWIQMSFTFEYSIAMVLYQSTSEQHSTCFEPIFQSNFDWLKIMKKTSHELLESSTCLFLSALNGAPFEVLYKEKSWQI